MAATWDWMIRSCMGDLTLHGDLRYGSGVSYYSGTLGR